MEQSTRNSNGKLELIRQGIVRGNQHVELMIHDYLSSFIDSLKDFRIDWQKINNSTVIDIMYPSIEQINEKKEEFVQMLELIATSKSLCTGEVFALFFEGLLQFYQDNEITLYTSKEPHILSYDNYRYLNQSLFISFTAVMIENLRFDVLADVVNSRFLITNSNRLGGLDDVNFIRFREYNYTLNEFLNEKTKSNAYSYTALVMKNHSLKLDFRKMVDADILLYYLSLLYPGDQFLDRFWCPETAAFNHKAQILPKLVSKKYFNKAKVLFGTNTVEEFKEKIVKISQAANQYHAYGAPDIMTGLCVNQVGTLD